MEARFSSETPNGLQVAMSDKTDIFITRYNISPSFTLSSYFCAFYLPQLFILCPLDLIYVIMYYASVHENTM
jgi:hypothetical protein